MKAQLPFIAGLAMAPLCVFGLLWGWAPVWVLCPQALAVMFIREAQHAYDSIGAADFPDLIAAALYYPIVGWILRRAIKLGSFSRISIRLILWHAVAIGLALGAAHVRNWLWGF